MSTDLTAPSTDELRERAVKRLRKKSDFKIHLLIYLTVNAFLVIVWAMTGSPFFWPIFPIAGWGIGLVMNAWDVYWRRDITEDDIQHEIDREHSRS